MKTFMERIHSWWTGDINQWWIENLTERLSDREMLVLRHIAEVGFAHGLAPEEAYFAFFRNNADEERWKKHRRFLLAVWGAPSPAFKHDN